MKFNIAIGKSRTDKKWKNQQIEWDEFKDRVSKTHRTAETIDEYFSFKKDRQDEIKDVGGFVGGYLSGGRRLVSSVLNRQLITMDADSATKDFWEKFCLQYDSEALIYSTHKHTPESPRYRLIIPLDREVFQDEYYAICRRIAGDVGIDIFDHTGYQPHRLMYWPSTSSDGEFIFKHQKGKFLSADSVLGRYVNWQDVSEWPTGKNETKTLDNSIKKQGEPSEKPGLIGAFNRAYGIDEAIELFLSDVYEKSDIKDRYTFKEGSTASGVIVYDNKFSYSHHSTDPASGVLCNSFDLVRLHKFGVKDDEDDFETPVNKRPSYLAMCEFVSKDTLVKKQIGEDKLRKAKNAFEDVDVDDSSDDVTDWIKKMDVDTKGNFSNTLNNISLILDNDPVFKNNLTYDEFEQIAFFKRKLPWRKIDQNASVTENDLANIENYIEKVYKITTGNEKLKKGLFIIFEKNKIHSVRDYLATLKWDGVERVDTLLSDFLGCDQSEYVKAVTRKTLVAAVARVQVPGVKFDNILTLVGDEGQGKSQLFARLGQRWFSDTFNLHMLQTKEAYEQIQGVWLIEIPELTGLAKAEVERVKGFVSATQDRYRPPYARTTETMKRQCVFVATTNLDDFLKSQSGNRRFWPVRTFVNQPKYDVYKLTQDDINQIWAEAVELYNKKESLYLTGKLLSEAIAIQSDHTEENPYVALFDEYLSKKVPENWFKLSRWDKIELMNNYENEDKSDWIDRKKTCNQELWEICLNEKNKMSLVDLRTVKQAMNKVPGWKRIKENTRFETSYPRQKGAYITEKTNHFENLL